MRLPRFKKVVVLGAIAAVAIGAAGMAAAYFTTTGLGTSTVTVSSAPAWTVSVSHTPTGDIGPGTVVELTGTVKNGGTKGNQAVKELVVKITGITPSTCPASDFKLVQTGTYWTISKTTTTTDTATRTDSGSPVVIDHGQYLVGGADSSAKGNALQGTSSSTLLKLAMKTTATQNVCESASVALSLTVH